MKIKQHTFTCTLFLVLTTLSTLQAYPPDNAAVLYYRAFMVMKEPSKEVGDMISKMRKDKAKATEAVKQCLQENRHMIRFVETAASIPTCDWGRDESQGFDLLLPELGKIRGTAFLLIADAQIQAEQGNYKAALTKCLTVHKMARHVGDDLIISFLVGVAVHDLANQRIEDILSEMPAQRETLTWLKNELVSITSRTISIKTAMNREKEIALNEIRRDKMDTILESFCEDATNNPIYAKSIAQVRKGDETFFKKSRDYYSRTMTETIVALNLPYLQAHKTLTGLNERVQKDAKKNPSAILTAMLTPAVARICSLEIRNQTRFNAIGAAIDVYLTKVRTGQLPEVLPAGVPLDMFSGKVFIYEKSKDGFVLRCQAKDMGKNSAHEYTFQLAE